MELRELRTFVTVVEEGGLSAAGRKLYLSQPAISQIIQTLEKRFDVELLVRSRSGVSATPAGKTLLTEARALLARHEQATALMARHGTDEPKELRLAVPLELPTNLLSAALATLPSRFPATNVTVRHLTTANQIKALSTGDLDLGLVRQRPVGGQLETSLVAEEELGVLLAADQAAKLRGPQGIRLESLHEMSWLGFDRSDSPAWYDELTAVLRSHGVYVVPSQIAMGEPTFEVKLAAVSAGGVFALAPASWAQNLPPSVSWSQLSASPVRRRTWAAWATTSHRRDLTHILALLKLSR